MRLAELAGRGGPWGLRSRRVVGPHGSAGIGPATLRIEDGRISAVIRGAGPGALPPDDPLLPVCDVGDRVIGPGLVDCHVHVNEPGRTDWEGFQTATRAAAAGGVTTLVDMPLNCIDRKSVV